MDDDEIVCRCERVTAGRDPRADPQRRAGHERAQGRHPRGHGRLRRQDLPLPHQAHLPRGGRPRCRDHRATQRPIFMEVPLGAFAGRGHRARAPSRTWPGPTPWRLPGRSVMGTAVYDVIVIGAGSVGMPAAMHLAEKGHEGLVLDQFASPGPGQQQGGHRRHPRHPLRPRQDQLCLESLETSSTWKEKHGDDIEWSRGGYVFVAYRPEEEKVLKDLLVIQKEAGLNIDWYDAEELLASPPGSTRRACCGGTFSPEDGSASPMLCNLRLLPARRGTRCASAASTSGSPASCAARARWWACAPTRAATPPAASSMPPGAWARAAGAGRRPRRARATRTATKPASPSRWPRFLDPMVVDIRPDAGLEQLLLLPARARPGGLLHHPRPAHRRHRPPRDLAPSCPWSPGAWSTSCPGWRT